MWFQRSRAKWMIDGNRNTRYYHLKVVNRRRKKHIVMLKDNEFKWIEKEEKLKELVNNFYKDIFKLWNNCISWYQTKYTFPTLTEEDISNLDVAVTDNEVKKAIYDMKPWKAPRPDGFSAGFYQILWNIV